MPPCRAFFALYWPPQTRWWITCHCLRVQLPLHSAYLHEAGELQNVVSQPKAVPTFGLSSTNFLWQAQRRQQSSRHEGQEVPFHRCSFNVHLDIRKYRQRMPETDIRMGKNGWFIIPLLTLGVFEHLESFAVFAIRNFGTYVRNTVAMWGWVKTLVPSEPQNSW